MTGWPAIEEPELLERLALNQADFEAFFNQLLASFPRRELDAKTLRRALGYPWHRPQGSFLLVDGAVAELDAMAPSRQRAVWEDFVVDRDRFPLLAFGANGSPGGLELKFAHFPDLIDRSVLVVTGRLHDFDVGASAQPTIYGAMPATLFPSLGTEVRASLIWVTHKQFTQLAWSEVSYELGKLGARFSPDIPVADDPDFRVEEVLAFISRFGAFHRGAGPIALAAISARGRTAEAMTQKALLDAAAKLCLGPDAAAEDFLRAAFRDLGGMFSRTSAPIRRQSVPFCSELWTPFPAREAGAR